MKKNRININCNVCGKLFIVPKCREKKAKVCSLICRYKGQIIERKIKKCLYCEKEFGIINHNKDKKFCSKSCSITYRNLKKGDESNNVFVLNGYIYMRAREHHRANSGYVKRATIIAEWKYKRKLKPREHVHHINGDTLDDRPENLQIVTASDHMKIHQQMKNKQFYIA